MIRRPHFRQAPKEPGYWTRQRSAMAPATGGAAAQATILTPSSNVAGNLDTRVTVFGIRLSFAIGAVFAAAPNSVRFDIGLAVTQPAQTFSPTLAAAADQRADWLDLFSILVPCTGAIISEGVYLDRLLDRAVKAKRKLTQEDQLSLFVQATGASVTNTVSVHSSVYWKRTLK